MKKSIRIHSLFLFLVIFAACNKNDDNVLTPTAGAPFEDDPEAKLLSPLIEEISGITDSKTAPGFIWAHEDSGNPPEIYLINHSGDISKKIHIKGAKNSDWEDMALAGDQLFVAGIGDNEQNNSNYTIYQFTEPTAATDTVFTYKKIKFKYPDGSHDAEAFLIDPKTQDLLIITKQDNPSRIYKLPYPYKYSGTETATYVGNLTFSGAVSAALSPDGKEAILKSYARLYYYNQNSGESIAEMLQREPGELAYRMEPQGEAVSFAANNSGFFTLSEKGFTSSVNLYFYPRK